MRFGIDLQVSYDMGDVKDIRTETIPLRPSILTMKPRVQARSLGE